MLCLGVKCFWSEVISRDLGVWGVRFLGFEVLQRDVDGERVRCFGKEMFGG